MKKIFLVLILTGFFMSSCSSAKNTTQKAVYKPAAVVAYKIGANPKEILSPIVGNDTLSALTYSELLGTLVQITTHGKKVEITPLTKVDSTSVHKEGVIIRGKDYSGDNPYVISDGSGWMTHSIVMNADGQYPVKWNIEAPSKNGKMRCLTMVLSESRTMYLHKLNIDKNNNVIISNAGYQFTDCGDKRIYYTNYSSTQIKNIFINEIKKDSREKEEVKGYKIPITKN